jgi:ribosomal protein L37AE/L43A
MQTVQCVDCGSDYNIRRRMHGWLTCLDCGELDAKQVKHTIVPMHKSNYQPITDLNLLKGINSKTGWF